MKTLYTLIALIAINTNLFSQAPQKLSYQAVIRNSSGGLVVSHTVGMKISILQGSESGTAVYVETHTTTTNANGLATIEIGGGSVVSGTFATINWASGTYYLKSETDPAGGSSYTIVGTSQLLSVPYALNSKTSESVADNSITSAKIVDGTITNTDLGNNSVTSAKITDATIAAADLASNSVTTDKINAGAVTGSKIAQGGATNGQALKWNNTTSAWIPADDLTGGGITLPYSGSGSSEDAVFNVTNTYSSESLSAYGLQGTTSSSNGSGIAGIAMSTTGPNAGVYGRSFSETGRGVFGLITKLTGANSGVHGESASDAGAGLSGRAYSATGTNYGVFGESESESGYGVYGESPRYGVYGRSTNSGIAVKGEAISASSIGVQGMATNTGSIGVFGKGSVNGVYGEASASTGKGINGYVTSETGVTYGIYGMSMSVSGYGVYGKAASETGTNYGVYGESASANGYAGYFKGRFYETGSTTGNTDLFYVTNTGTGRAIHAVAAGNTAVWGASTSGYAGVDGRNSSGIGVSGHSDTNYGVYGKSNDSYGVFGTSGLTGGRFEGVSTGVYGISTGTAGINFGVYGKTNSAAGYAGYFEGNVKVTGTLSKGGGSFEIDHPLDPANKILRHSFVESPDMMNVYNGNIRTDANGIAEVILPDYFEALNRDFRYQLTVMGEFAQAIIGEKISDNRFTIRTDKPDVEVSWQVTGIRKDPWAAVNRILVEEKKSQTLQGHYLYPELYGNSVNPSIIRIEERGKKKMAKDQDIINGS
jgi:hypothetical protein